MKRQSLTFRLLCFSAAAVVVPAVLISLIYRSISVRALERSIEQGQTELARRVAEQVNQEIYVTQHLVRFIAQTPSFAANSSFEQQQALLNLIYSAPSLQEAMVVLPSGKERVKVTRRGPESRLIRRTESLKNSFIGAPFFSGNRLPTILIGEPIQPRHLMNAGRGEFLLAKMSFAELGALMQQTRIGDHGTAYIVDQHGLLLASPDEERVRAHANLSQVSVVKSWLAAPAQPTALHEYQGANKTTMIALAYPIPLLKSAVVVEQPKADVYAPLVRMRNQAIGFGALCVAFFLGLALWMGWRILKPLRLLQEAAEHVAQGKRDFQLDIHTRDEIEDLGTAFTSMAKSLQQIETMRADLNSMIVHDLKSPLSTILASLDFVLDEGAQSLGPDLKRFIQGARRSGQDLLMMVKNLLDVAKMEEGKLMLERERFEPSDWAQKVVDSFRPVAELSKKKLELVCGETLPGVEGDMALLSRVLSNLISNALRYTPSQDASVTVTLRQQANVLAVEVSDNGQGIAREDQRRIFEKFVQAEGKKGNTRSGTGLGLTFCKMVVEAHGGRIFVESMVDEGSTFTFLLPLAELEAGVDVPSSRDVETAAN